MRKWMLASGALLICVLGIAARVPGIVGTSPAADSPVAANEVRQSVPASDGRTVVVWISVDGMRGDYVDLADAPFCRRLMKEGAFTRQLAGGFPSLTFPSHVAQATGTSVDRHGVIGNAIFDFEKDQRWPHPNQASVLLSEPIWTTAKRGGRRVLVYDWPVSQQQTGEWQADYFHQTFDSALTDRERLDRLIAAWRQDAGTAPLQLLMGYVAAVDQAGHKYGPAAPETLAAVEETDALLADFFARCQTVFADRMQPRDRLYFLLSTDHGMHDVHEVVNLRLMCGAAWNDEMRLVTSGCVGNLFLHRLGPPPARKVHVEKLLQALRAYPFARAYARQDLPAKWQYGHDARTGDVVAVLDPGYFFTEREGPLRSKIVPGEGPRGMHGYPHDECPQMLGFLAMWRSKEPWGGQDLGPIDARRLHATVASWLEVKPSRTAVSEVIEAPR